MTLVIKVKRIRNHDLPLPSYQSSSASGLDLRADIDEPVLLNPLERTAIPTGFALQIPVGFEGQVRPRSGRALDEGLTVLNAPGTIDSDFRGELRVILINLGQSQVRIEPGDRVAQLVISPVQLAQLVEADELEETGRGTGGFGHSGR